VVLGYRHRVQSHFAYGAITRYGQTFQTVRLCVGLVTRRDLPQDGPTTPRDNSLGLGYFPVRSPLLGESLFDFFSSGYLDVSVHRVCLNWLIYSARRYRGITLDGLPHSGIPGSTPACGSPRLIAANHALHRFLAPRHPPCALSSLTIKPLPTNGLQVEGQGSVQEPWRSRPHVGPTRPTRGILPPRRFKNSRLRCDRSSTIASTFTIRFSKSAKYRGAGWEV
jgi:hypothetical protein